MQTLLHDLRYAFRRLRRSPGFTLTAVLTLALGLGATTAIFTLVYQVVLRSMPVSHPEQLYKVGTVNCGGCVNAGFQDDWNVFSTELYSYLRDQTPGTAFEPGGSPAGREQEHPRRERAAAAAAGHRPGGAVAGVAFNRVASLLLFSALVAALVPGRRAASIDPMYSLRTE